MNEHDVIEWAISTAVQCKAYEGRSALMLSTQQQLHVFHIAAPKIPMPSIQDNPYF